MFYGGRVRLLTIFIATYIFSARQQQTNDCFLGMCKLGGGEYDTPRSIKESLPPQWMLQTTGPEEPCLTCGKTAHHNTVARTRYGTRHCWNEWWSVFIFTLSVSLLTVLMEFEWCSKLTLIEAFLLFNYCIYRYVCCSVVVEKDDSHTAMCPCQRVMCWAGSWMRLPYLLTGAFRANTITGTTIHKVCMISCI